MSTGNTTEKSRLIRDTEGCYHQVPQEELLSAARECIIERFARGEEITSPAAAGRYLQLLLGTYDHEVFTVLWLDNRHRVIGHSELFRGTIDAASVYPREVVKEGLACNAAAVILAHNHPSGVSDPSQADIKITARLKEALQLVEIRVLDHLVIGDTVTSMADRGLL